LPALQFGDSDALRQGQLVLAFGSPLGLENSVSAGVVSAVARQMRPDQRMIYVQTDASINPGNSGGPLVDVEGRLVGINTFILSQSGGNEGLGFAAPSNIVRNVFEQIRRTGRVHRGEIGVHAQTLTPALAAGLGVHQDWGVLLADALPDGAAANAGLEIGDVILRLDGKLMENARQLEVNLYRHAVGDIVSVDFLRGSRRLSLGVVVAERSDDPDRFAEMVTPEANILEGLGILALDLDERIARRLPALRAQAGVVVAAGAGDGPSWRDPLLPGDVIYALNRQSVTSVATLRAALSRLSPLDPVVLQVERAGQLRFIALERD
jgi:serine protease Do